MQNAIDEAELKSLNSRPMKVHLPPCVSLGAMSHSQGEAKRKRPSDTSGSETMSGGAIGKAFNIKERDHLMVEIARMFYSAGLPFYLARNPYFVSAFSYAATHNIPGFVPPGYNLLRTTLLQREKANIDNLLQLIKSTWEQNGVSIVSDRWSDSQRRPLINFMAVSGGGPMFLKAVDCSGEIKDKYFTANLMKDVINEVGPQNVVQIITDNAPNCKAAGQLIEAQFPHILWTPCVVDTLNLALKNICAAKHVENNETTYSECSWISDIAGDCTIIKNFITNHSMRLAMYNEFVSLKLLSVAEIRFASTIVMLKRFKLIKGGLQAMVINDKWSCYREDDVGRARFVKDKVLSDVWWDSIDYILKFTGPIYDMIRACDTNTPCLHLVYDMWDSMIEQVKAAIYRHEGKMHEEDSTFLWYYSDDWLHESANRVPPHKDEEVSRERLKCLKRYFDNHIERTKVNSEFAQFSMNDGPFRDVDSIQDRGAMNPRTWWGRIWFIRTFPPKFSIEDAYATFFLILLRTPQYAQGDNKMWDIAGDNFDSLDDVGVLEIANLSLDEPEMEAVLFNDVGDEEEDNINDEA
ncbi:hypothetical protein Acr_03g0012710 [Actinidia rufa]|uniref:DUF659 domain-containing protein n=1 Tax=Actinidia rufa TaxID=165716 RepID=A0A7J0EFU0_9ERIC|nr:hypothetical protein Acr_03g0012710 [Actinidia rufa]